MKQINADLLELTADDLAYTAPGMPCTGYHAEGSAFAHKTLGSFCGIIRYRRSGNDKIQIVGGPPFDCVYATKEDYTKYTAMGVFGLLIRANIIIKEHGQIHACFFDGVRNIICMELSVDLWPGQTTGEIHRKDVM